MVADALKEAVAKHQGECASPDVCGRIKREFIHIMRSRHGVDWSGQARRIAVEFIDGRSPNLVIAPELMQRSLH
jgi:hypothetical protein